jgi:aldose 1-epimerase
MFSIATKITTEFTKVILQDDATNTQVALLPNCGAILQSFSIQKNNNTINVIEGYESEEDFKKNCEAKGFRSCKLSPFACRLHNATYNLEEKKYTIKKFLLGTSAIHGLLYKEVFTIADTWANNTSAGVTLTHTYTGSDAGYPFLFTCTVTYILTQHNNLQINTLIINNDDKNIPMQDGWHPYFTFGNSINELHLKFNSENVVEFDAALIPTGKLTSYNTFNNFKKIENTFFDNCFVLKNNSDVACVIKDEKRQIQIEIFADKNYPYLQVYTPPHRQSIAVENLSAAPDAFNNGMGLNILQPKQRIEFKATYKVTKL